MYYHFYINETKKRQFVNTNIELIRKLKKKPISKYVIIFLQLRRLNSDIISYSNFSPRQNSPSRKHNGDKTRS